VLAFALNVRDAKGWSALVAEVRAKFGSIDILVSDAGIAVPGDTVDEVDEDLWDSIEDINAKGVWPGMKAVLPTMIANKRGKICNVASTAAHIGLKNAAAYCASKGAVAGPDPASRRAIRPAQRPDQFGVPGHYDDGNPDADHRRIARCVPAAHAGRPFRTARGGCRGDPVPSSEGSSFVTGADLSVDGGMVAM
jgi:NAD(P)-dependent dehydrogenase (short-subunit alcohol dehydrogenase family)